MNAESAHISNCLNARSQCTNARLCVEDWHSHTESVHFSKRTLSVHECYNIFVNIIAMRGGEVKYYLCMDLNIFFRENFSLRTLLQLHIFSAFLQRLHSFRMWQYNFSRWTKSKVRMEPIKALFMTAWRVNLGKNA